jgi:hypothetical protein
MCPREVGQNGKDGYEIGINKWFPTLEPWNTIMILCKDCGKKFAKDYGINLEWVDKAEPMNRS